MADYKYDTHSHTTTSDGGMHWKELLNYAKEQGLEGIAITDHNTMGPVSEIAQEAKRLGLKYIPSTEIKTTCKKQIEEFGSEDDLLPTLEFLIYGMNPEDEEFQSMSKKHIDGKKAYVTALCNQVNKHKVSDIEGLQGDENIDVDVDKIIDNNGDYLSSSHVINEILNKYSHLATTDDFGKKQVKNLVVAVQKDVLAVLKDDPFYSLDTIEGLRKAKKWGKRVVLAHPFTESRANMFEFYDKHLIPLLVENGLDGIECIYPEHTPEQIEIIKGWADKYDLILTGGSDFHRKEDEFYALGSKGVSEEVFDELEG